jgi:hypothetical protein
MVSSCPQMVSTDLYEGFEETVEDIHLPQLPAVAFQVRVLLAGGHLAAEPVVELFSGGPEVSEMQDETQEASATSSLGSLILNVPRTGKLTFLTPFPNLLVAVKLVYKISQTFFENLRGIRSRKPS